MIKAINRLLASGIASWENSFFACSESAYRIAFMILLVIMVIFLILLFSTPCIYFWQDAGDSAIMLDGAWRIINGQRFHTDFYSPLGVMPFLIIAMGMKIGGFCGRSLIYGPALIFPIVSLYGWTISKRRLPAFLAIIFALMNGFLIIGNYGLGIDGFRDTSYTVQYNRLGWSLICLMLLQVYIKPQKKLSRQAVLFEGLGAGVLLSLILFVKINYFMIAVFAIIFGLLLITRTARLWLGIAGSFIITSFSVLVTLKINIFDYIRDIKMLAHANSAMMVIRRMVELALDNSGSLAIVLFAGAVMSKSLFRKNGGSLQTEWQRNILAVLGLICFGLAICSANYQKSQIPLFGLGALVLCEAFRRNMLSIEKDAKDQPENTTRYLAGALASLYLMGLILVPDASSIAYTLRWRSLCASPYIPKHARVPSDTMKDMVFPPKHGTNKEESLIIDEIVRGLPWNSDYYSYTVNNGLSLLRQRVNKGSRILVMEYINPFPFALKLPGPSGNALFWRYGQVISDRDYPAPEKVFRGVTLVLTRTLATETSDFMQRAYGPYLQKWFEKIDESPIWVLFKRRDMK